MGLFNLLFKNSYGNNNSINQDLQEEEDKFELQVFDEETALEPHPNNLNLDFLQDYNIYSGNGIKVQGATMTLKLLYEGILADEGTEGIYAVVGYGNNLKWEDIDYYPLKKVGTKTFELMFPIKREGNINIAFKDDNDNWDNNNSMNYTFANEYYQTIH
jgi:hypothetical protein